MKIFLTWLFLVFEIVSLAQTANPPQPLPTTFFTRRIVGTARITTQAGTFECYHIHEELEFDAGPINKMAIEEYYNPEVGIVKMENANGYYMELVRVKKKK
jgi:hypothetical protein